VVELTVVCPSCSSEVSPYVTECPYCGARVRKRAPDLERRGEELAPKESRREKRDRRRNERGDARRERAMSRPVPQVELGGRTWVAWPLIGVPALWAVLIQAGVLETEAFDAAVGGPSLGWWHDLVASFVYFDAGYLFVVGFALALTVPGVERRIGLVPTAFLVLALAGLSMLAADGAASVLDETSFAAGGNGLALGVLAAYFVMRRAEVAAGADDEGYDPLLIGVGAAVLLLLPVVDSWADIAAGVGGGACGLVAGAIAARVRARG
jgi:hypothetical protein